MMLLKTAAVTAAMSIEVLFGTDRVYRDELHALRPFPGQLASARNISRLLQRSPLGASHRDSPHLVQDAYSLRCTPQVYGAPRDTLAFAEVVALREFCTPPRTTPSCSRTARWRAAGTLDLRSPLQPSSATGAVRELFRRDVPFVEKDQFLGSHLKITEELGWSGALVEAAEELVELR
jgi:histidine ammonia-lyase